MNRHRQHLSDGPTEIPAWKSCERCRHFAQRAGMAGGDCEHPTAVRVYVGTGARYIQRDHYDHVVTPGWCPVLTKERP
jgi:hypothetical protein